MPISLTFRVDKANGDKYKCAISTDSEAPLGYDVHGLQGELTVKRGKDITGLIESSRFGRLLDLYISKGTLSFGSPTKTVQSTFTITDKLEIEGCITFTYTYNSSAVGDRSQSTAGEIKTSAVTDRSQNRSTSRSSAKTIAPQKGSC